MRLQTNAATTAANNGVAGLPRVASFGRYVISTHFGKTSNGQTNDERSAAYARRRWPNDRALIEAHTVKGMTSDGEYGGGLDGAGTPRLQFVQAWRQRALLPQLVGAVDVPTRTRFVGLGSRPTLGVITEGQAIPVLGLSDQGVALSYVKVAGLVVATAELLEAPGSEAWLGRALLSADAVASDTALLSTSTGVLAGVTPLTFGGSGVDEIVFSVRELLEALTAAQPSPT
jgi:hypothetical protein